MIPSLAILRSTSSRLAARSSAARNATTTRSLASVASYANETHYTKADVMALLNNKKVSECRFFVTMTTMAASACQRTGTIH